MPTFKDYPDFKPNLTPKQVLKLGSFGGTYFRDIDSQVTQKSYRGKNVIKKYPAEWFRGLDLETMVLSPKYDKSVNKYKVKCGSSLKDWEKKDWIVAKDPYGWFQWYCHFYMGRRSKDDSRQIERWKKLAGPNGRFRRNLMNQIIRKGKQYNDFTISPVIRQTLQHWGYKLTKAHLESYKKSKKGTH